MVDFSNAEDRKRFRHTASHIMAQAVKRLWPETKLAIGPAIDEGFYYDFDRDEAFSEADLKKIEVYIKPEDDRVYYVFNDDVSGSFPIINTQNDF